MPPIKEKPAAAAAATGFVDAFQDRKRTPSFKPIPRVDQAKKSATQPAPLSSPRYEPRSRRQIEAIHALGPVVMPYLAEELAGDDRGRLRRVTVLGIDIGVACALALITPGGELLEIADMPILRDGPKNRATVSGPLLAEIVYRWHAVEAFVEHVSARHGEGPVGAFAFGRSRGVIEGVLAACGVPTSFITPPVWKRAVSLTLASKDAARAEAIRRWLGQSALFARVKDDGRAEAALIATAGLARVGAKGGARAALQLRPD